MATPIATAQNDNSVRDNTGDTVDGIEVDANPLLIAQIMDGTSETMLNQDTTASDGLRIRNPEFTDISAAAGGIRTAARIRHDPSSGTVTDNDGVEILFQGDNDASPAEKISYAAIEVTFLDVSDGSEDSQLAINIMKAGSETAAFTATIEGGVLVWKLGNIRLWEDTANALFRIKFSAVTSETDGSIIAYG